MLLIFLKAPIPGLVKTRLATEYGDNGACEIYKKLTESVLNSAQKSGRDTTICFYPEHGRKVVNEWIGEQNQIQLQKGADLGARMKNAFIDTFCHGVERAVLIGTDIPDLDEKIIKTAFKKLDKHDCVIGPSLDGGYYLIGFTKAGFTQNVFNDIIWGTDTVLKETTAALDSAHVSYFMLEFKNDIDTPEDYRDYIEDK